MSYGFVATNANGQVLVSSATRNLHFVGKATLSRTIKSFDNYGGLRQWAYQISCNVTPMPFFTMPTQDYYAVAAVRQTGAAMWEIEVIRSGTSAGTPEVYVFADPRGATTNPDTNYGMQVFLPDGTLSFDSRRDPLVVTGGGSVAPPSNPMTGGPSSLSARYCGDGSNSIATTPAVPVNGVYNGPGGIYTDGSGIYGWSTSSEGDSYLAYYAPATEDNLRTYGFGEDVIAAIYPTATQPATPAGTVIFPDTDSDYSFTAVGSKPMFFYPSIAQAQREFEFSDTDRDCLGINVYGACIGFGDKYYYSSRYWAFFRSGIRYITGTLSCGWISVEYGCNWSYRDKSQLLGIGIGSSSSTGGAWPYSNETLNLTPTAFIVADAASHD